MLTISRITLNSFTYIGNRTGQDIMIHSLITSYVPGHLPFFRFLIQLISVSVTSMSSASEFKFQTPKYS